MSQEIKQLQHFGKVVSALWGSLSWLFKLSKLVIEVINSAMTKETWLPKSALH